MGTILVSGGMPGTGSDDCTAKKEHVLSGYYAITSDSGDEPAAGTLTLAKMTSDATATAEHILVNKKAYNNGQLINGQIPNITDSCEKAKSVVLSNGRLCMRMSKGAHLVSTTAGYPEVYAAQADAAKALGLTAEKLKRGQTVAGIAGTGVQRVKSMGDNVAYGFGNTDEYGNYDESFTVPAKGTVYYSGFAASYNEISTVICEIYKNGALVDSRNIDANNKYNYRGTMLNKSFSVAAGDVIRIRLQHSNTRYGSCAIMHAVIVYD